MKKLLGIASLPFFNWGSHQNAMKLFLVLLSLLPWFKINAADSRDVHRFVKTFNQSYLKTHNLTFCGTGMSIPKGKLLLIDLD